MKRVTAPGLPAWPLLFLDPEKKRAVVTGRFAAWRSYEAAILCTKMLRAMLAVYLVWWIWDQLPPGTPEVLRFAIALVGSLVVTALTRPVMTEALHGFLARQVFSKRITVWFRPDAMAFRSPLYSRGVVIHRSWKGRPVQARFDVGTDANAAEKRMRVQQRTRDVMHFEMARLLRVIVSTVNTNQIVTSTTQSNFVRSIPMLEIDMRDAQRVTVVLAAAASLTSASGRTKSRTEGVDIDGVDG